jgi:hypothetical protein
MGRLFEAIGRADGAIGNRREAKGYRRKARVNQQTSKGGLLIAFNQIKWYSSVIPPLSLRK